MVVSRFLARFSPVVVFGPSGSLGAFGCLPGIGSLLLVGCLLTSGSLRMRGCLLGSGPLLHIG